LAALVVRQVDDDGVFLEASELRCVIVNMKAGRYTIGTDRMRRSSLRELGYAKGIQDMLRIQMFMQAQMAALGEQAKSLGEAFIKAASGQTNKPSA
jgi:hypothetical protein